MTTLKQALSALGSCETVRETICLDIYICIVGLAASPHYIKPSLKDKDDDLRMHQQSGSYTTLDDCVSLILND